MRAEIVYGLGQDQDAESIRAACQVLDHYRHSPLEVDLTVLDRFVSMVEPPQERGGVPTIPVVVSFVPVHGAASAREAVSRCTVEVLPCTLHSEAHAMGRPQELALDMLMVQQLMHNREALGMGKCMANALSSPVVSRLLGHYAGSLARLMVAYPHHTRRDIVQVLTHKSVVLHACEAAVRKAIKHERELFADAMDSPGVRDAIGSVNPMESPENILAALNTVERDLRACKNAAEEAVAKHRVDSSRSWSMVPGALTLRPKSCEVQIQGQFGALTVPPTAGVILDAKSSQRPFSNHGVAVPVQLFTGMLAVLSCRPTEMAGDSSRQPPWEAWASSVRKDVTTPLDPIMVDVVGKWQRPWHAHHWPNGEAGKRSKERTARQTTSVRQANIALVEARERQKTLKAMDVSDEGYMEHASELARADRDVANATRVLKLATAASGANGGWTPRQGDSAHTGFTRAVAGAAADLYAAVVEWQGKLARRTQLASPDMASHEVQGLFVQWIKFADLEAQLHTLHDLWSRVEIHLNATKKFASEMRALVKTHDELMFRGVDSYNPAKTSVACEALLQVYTKMAEAADAANRVLGNVHTCISDTADSLADIVDVVAKKAFTAMRKHVDDFSRDLHLPATGTDDIRFKIVASMPAGLCLPLPTATDVNPAKEQFHAMMLGQQQVLSTLARAHAYAFAALEGCRMACVNERARAPTPVIVVPAGEMDMPFVSLVVATMLIKELYVETPQHMQAMTSYVLSRYASGRAWWGNLPRYKAPFSVDQAVQAATELPQSQGNAFTLVVDHLMHVQASREKAWKVLVDSNPTEDFNQGIAMLNGMRDSQRYIQKLQAARVGIALDISQSLKALTLAKNASENKKSLHHLLAFVTCLFRMDSRDLDRRIEVLDKHTRNTDFFGGKAPTRANGCDGDEPVAICGIQAVTKGVHAECARLFGCPPPQLSETTLQQVRQQASAFLRGHWAVGRDTTHVLPPHTPLEVLSGQSNLPRLASIVVNSVSPMPAVATRTDCINAVLTQVPNACMCSECNHHPPIGPHTGVFVQDTTEIPRRFRRFPSADQAAGVFRVTRLTQVFALSPDGDHAAGTDSGSDEDEDMGAGAGAGAGTGTDAAETLFAVDVLDVLPPSKPQVPRVGTGESASRKRFEPAPGSGKSMKPSSKRYTRVAPPPAVAMAVCSLGISDDGPWMDALELLRTELTNYATKPYGGSLEAVRQHVKGLMVYPIATRQLACHMVTSIQTLVKELVIKPLAGLEATHVYTAHHVDRVVDAYIARTWPPNGTSGEAMLGSTCQQLVRLLQQKAEAAHRAGTHAVWQAHTADAKAAQAVFQANAHLLRNVLFTKHSRAKGGLGIHRLRVVGLNEGDDTVWVEHVDAEGCTIPNASGDTAQALSFKDLVQNYVGRGSNRMYWMWPGGLHHALASFGIGLLLSQLRSASHPMLRFAVDTQSRHSLLAPRLYSWCPVVKGRALSPVGNMRRLVAWSNTSVTRALVGGGGGLAWRAVSWGLAKEEAGWFCVGSSFPPTPEDAHLQVAVAHCVDTMPSNADVLASVVSALVSQHPSETCVVTLASAHAKRVVVAGKGNFGTSVPAMGSRLPPADACGVTTMVAKLPRHGTVVHCVYDAPTTGTSTRHRIVLTKHVQLVSHATPARMRHVSTPHPHTSGAARTFQDVLRACKAPPLSCLSVGRVQVKLE